MVRSKSSCLGPCVYREVPDGGWGWVVAAAFFMVEVCTYGTIKSLGIFLQEWMEEFGETNSRVSWVISICVFTLTFTAPLSTFLSNRYGFQPVVMIGGFLISLGTITSAFTRTMDEMYITIGVISGLGYCFTFLPSVTILAQYFCRRRALVASIASSGECFAMFAFAPAFTALKEQIGWRYCLIIIGAIQTSVIGCGALLRPIVIEPEAEPEGPQVSKHLQAQYELENEHTRTSISSGESQGSGDSGVTSLSASSALAEAGEAEAGEAEAGEAEAGEAEAGEAEAGEAEAGPVRPFAPKLLDFSVLKDGAFICYSLFGLMATLGFFAPQLYVVQLSRSRGVEPATASYMLSVIAAGDAAGRLSIGLVLSRARCRKTRVLLACVVMLCVVLLAFTLVWELWGLAACCALYGYFMGTVGSTHIPMLAEDDVVGIHRMASSVGVYVFIQSFAGLAGPPLGGMLVDVTHNYGSAFYSCAVGMGLGAVCLALVAPAKSGFCRRSGGRQETRRRAEDEESMSQDSSQPDFLEMDFVPGAVQKASVL